MDKKIITRISNEIGNQIFMYASTFAIAKKLNRKLIIDNESAFKSRKNISFMVYIILIFHQRLQNINLNI